MKFVSQGLFVKKFFKMVKIKNYTLATTVAHELCTSIFIFFFFVVKIIGFGKAYEPTGIRFLHRIRLEVEEERCEAVGACHRLLAERQISAGGGSGTSQSS
jgi:hypothetical protein